jgi:hypothetical protein
MHGGEIRFASGKDGWNSITVQLPGQEAFERLNA